MAYDPTTALNNLLTRKQAITVELASLVGGSGSAGSLPNASGGGISVDHVGYKAGLYKELAEIDDLIARMQGPYELRQQGMT